MRASSTATNSKSHIFIHAQNHLKYACPPCEHIMLLMFFDVVTMFTQCGLRRRRCRRHRQLRLGSVFIVVDFIEAHWPSKGGAGAAILMAQHTAQSHSIWWCDACLSAECGAQHNQQTFKYRFALLYTGALFVCEAFNVGYVMLDMRLVVQWWWWQNNVCHCRNVESHCSTKHQSHTSIENDNFMQPQIIIIMYVLYSPVCVLCMAEYVLCVVLHHSYYYINKWYIVLDNNKPLDALHCHSLQYIQCLALRVSCCLSRSARNKWFPFIMNGMAIFMCVVREYMSPGADIAFWLLYIFDSMVCVCVRVDGVRATEVNHVVVRRCAWPAYIVPMMR